MGPGEKIGFEFHETYDSQNAIIRNFKSIRIKSIQKYSPGDRSKIQVGDRITHIGNLKIYEKELVNIENGMLLQ